MEAENNNLPEQQAPATETSAAPSTTITAYCMKTKEKNVPMQDAVIHRTSRGGWMAMGHDGNGNKMTSMLSASSAQAALAAGTATMAIETP